MGRFLERIAQADPAFEVQASDDGYLLIRNESDAERFNTLARELIDTAGVDFAVFPTSDGHTGYERLFVIPL